MIKILKTEPGKRHIFLKERRKIWIVKLHFTIEFMFWSYIADMKIPATNAKHFSFLPKLAEIILIIPHSNAELERLFSIVKKNKSLERPSMELDGTLSSMLAIKTMYHG